MGIYIEPSPIKLKYGSSDDEEEQGDDFSSSRYWLPWVQDELKEDESEEEDEDIPTCPVYE